MVEKLESQHSLLPTDISGKGFLREVIAKIDAGLKLGMYKATEIQERALHSTLANMVNHAAGTIDHYGHAALKPTGLISSLVKESQGISA